MPGLELLKEKKHEQVKFVHDAASGLAAIIAVHNTTLGPALGGVRMHAYPNYQAALFDVLRLSEAMTYKNALCGIHCGGGKSVIIADRATVDGREALFKAFGRAVESLNGQYIAAEDMGTSVSDIENIGTQTAYIAGSDPKRGGGGDPSPYTALGVFGGMRACIERVFGSDDFSKRSVAIQGVGHVGYYLAKLLAEAGATLILSDVRRDVLRAVADEFGAQEASAVDILTVPVDILAPCAVGGVIDSQSILQLNCRIIAGAANNQLTVPTIEEVLADRGIIYAPDFAINAGGVILCADEFETGGFNESRVRERVSRIYNTVGTILDRAKETKQLAGVVALALANERIERAK